MTKQRSFIGSLFHSLVIFCTVMVGLLPLSGSAQTFARVESCVETVALQADGSAQVTIAIAVSANDSGMVAYPFMFGKQEVEISPASVTSELLQVEEEDDLWTLFLNTGDLDSITITFDVPNAIDWKKAGPFEFSAYKWGYRFRNWSGSVVDHYTMDIVLPDGWNYHRVINSNPPMKEKDTFPPYTFLKDDNRHSRLILSSGTLKLGDECSLRFIMKPVIRSSSMIVIGVVICLLYLWYFRFLLVKAREMAKKEKE